MVVSVKVVECICLWSLWGEIYWSQFDSHLSLWHRSQGSMHSATDQSIQYIIEIWWSESQILRPLEWSVCMWASISLSTVLLVWVSESSKLQTPLQGFGSSNLTDMTHILPILKPATILEVSASDSHIPSLSLTFLYKYQPLFTLLLPSPIQQFSD